MANTMRNWEKERSRNSAIKVGENAGESLRESKRMENKKSEKKEWKKPKMAKSVGLSLDGDSEEIISLLFLFFASLFFH